RERPAVERLREHALPQGARLLEPDTRVDDRPSRTVVEEPEIDVVEAEPERHAEPLDAREHVDGRARSGRLGPRMVEGHGPSLRYVIGGGLDGPPRTPPRGGCGGQPPPRKPRVPPRPLRRASTP